MRPPRLPWAGPGRVVLRPGGPADTEAAKALHRRCSAQTLMRRHHGPVDEADRCLPHLLSPHFGWALTAESPAGELLALGRLLWDGPETEVAPLVEDAWQARGIGGALLRWLMDLAVETSCPSVYAVTQPGNTGLIGALRGTGPPLSLALSEGVLVITTQPVQLPVAAGVRRAGG